MKKGQRKKRGKNDIIQTGSRKEHKHKYYIKNKEKILLKIKEYRKANPDKIVQKKGYYYEYWQNIRSQFFELYGKKCACCGESCESFLVLDHIKGKDRRCKNNRQSYLDALAEYDPNEYRTLCHNCNQATSGGKICPHQIKEKEANNG